jgi:hypothetical protein
MNEMGVSSGSERKEENSETNVLLHQPPIYNIDDRGI